MRRTKIVCTLGPASDSVEIMKELIRNGLDGARVNFSHGTYESHGEMINKLKQAREELGAPVPLILDTKGPEIRLKLFKDGFIMLETGDTFTLTTEEVEGTKEMVSVTYEDFAKDIKVGDRILIDDGLIELKAVDVDGIKVKCDVLNGGKVGSRKGVNLPGIKVNLPSLTEKDIEDLKFGIKMGFDVVAASFIRTADDVVKIRRVLEENGGEGIQIISKIENQEGVDNIDPILSVSDGIMVARGDMGVEIPPEEVPLIQKMMIKKANEQNKFVITATQMLESMQQSPRPTRAEANDVANAIFDGSDATMLSGETAAGKYPVEAVSTMARIAEKAEGSIDYAKKLTAHQNKTRTSITSAISYAACTTAAEMNASLIVTITASGYTARSISKYHPVCPIVAATMTERSWRQLNLVWGCSPMMLKSKVIKGETFNMGMKVAEDSGLVTSGDVVVMAIGMPLGISGATNTLRVDMVGDVLYKGKGIGTQVASGCAKVIRTADDLKKEFKPGEILVATKTDNEFMEVMKKASAIIVEANTDGTETHAEVVACALNIPVIVCDQKVIDTIPDNLMITVDANTGFVRSGIGAQEKETLSAANSDAKIKK
ncbi:MAG: pyruvate kinase [Bacillota bacterium]